MLFGNCFGEVPPYFWVVFSLLLVYGIRAILSKYPTNAEITTERILRI
ncbi:hypothetical protein [Helicobacter sp. MIT 05-5294]|nr:hypothetical protein [Helicobacter sp. MIT 05-5294]